jgi:carboxymethylenebutenolidase
VLRLFDQYVHGLIDRRGFLDGAARHVSGAGAAVAVLAALSPDFAAAQKVAPSDARLRPAVVEFASAQGHGKARGYLVRPAQAAGPLPLVLVVHENRGLNPHIEDITRRLALDNFIAFAPDALFPLGGYPGDEDKARGPVRQLDQAKTREDFMAAAQGCAAPGAQRQAGRRGLLLRRRHVQLPGHPAAGPGRPPCPSTATWRRPRMPRASRPNCC